MKNAIRELYSWEIELKNGNIIKKGNDFNFNDVIRISFIPNTKFLPRHDVIVSGFKVKKRFCRAFMGWNSLIDEYLHCVVTDKFRLYLKSSNGQCVITPPDYEWYISRGEK